MRRLWFVFLLIFLPLPFLFINCGSKEDKAKEIAYSVLNEIYTKRNYPDEFYNLYSQLSALYYTKGDGLRYNDIAKICLNATYVYKEYKKMRENYSQKAKQKGVYKEYADLMQKLFEKDCTYAPTMALYHRIDNLCEYLKKKGNLDKSYWFLFEKKFLKYYWEAKRIKEQCFKLVE